MNRLTEWVCDNQWYMPKKGISPNQIHNQLGKYEDTGLIPEEIVSLKSDISQLRECVADCNETLESHNFFLGQVIDKVQEMKTENATLKNALKMACEELCSLGCPWIADKCDKEECDHCKSKNNNQTGEQCWCDCWYEYLMHEARKLVGFRMQQRR